MQEISQVISEGFDRAWSLREFDASDNSTDGGSGSDKRDGNASGGASAST